MWFSLGAPIQTSAWGLLISALIRAIAGPEDRCTKATFMPVSAVNWSRIFLALASSTLE
jgi:hypothetical protein